MFRSSVRRLLVVLAAVLFPLLCSAGWTVTWIVFFDGWRGQLPAHGLSYELSIAIFLMALLAYMYVRDALTEEL